MSRNKVSIRGYKRPRVAWAREEGYEPLFTPQEVLQRASEALAEVSASYEEMYAEVFGAYHGAEALGHLATVAYHVGHSGGKATAVWRSIARQLQKQRRASRAELAQLRARGLEVARCYWAYMRAQ